MTLDGRGYEILRAAVPGDVVEAALRHVHLDLVRRGLGPQTIGEWLWSAHWFPHLKWDDEILALFRALPAELQDGELCDPQILLQPPDDAEEVDLVPHVDREPEWASGRRYRRIVGVALSRGGEGDGGLVVWPLGKDEPEAVELEPGDAVVMDPLLPHASGVNRGGAIRYALYFRFLGDS